VPPPLVGDWTPLSGYRAGQELAGRVTSGSARRRSARMTAVFVANDQMALGVMRAFREAGLSMPGQVAIAGFDDIPEAEFFTPPLTTIRQDFAAVGRSSIGLLVSRLDSGTELPDERVVIEPLLIVRGSSTAS
jgi:DNA-binding LacI/PurR family transcriptional regulator